MVAIPSVVGVPVPASCTDICQSVSVPPASHVISAVLSLVVVATTFIGSGQLTLKIETSSNATPSDCTELSDPNATLNITLVSPANPDIS